MTFDINSLVSIFSLVVALGAAFAAHRYFQRAEKQRDEELIQNALGVFARHRVVATTLKRARNSTGASLDEEEISMFGQIDDFSTVSEKLEKDLVKLLSSRAPLTQEKRSATLTSIALTERFSITLQLISERLQGQKNNELQQLQELREYLASLEQLLRNHSNRS